MTTTPDEVVIKIIERHDPVAGLRLRLLSRSYAIAPADQRAELEREVNEIVDGVLYGADSAERHATTQTACSSSFLPMFPGVVDALEWSGLPEGREIQALHEELEITMDGERRRELQEQIGSVAGEFFAARLKRR